MLPTGFQELDDLINGYKNEITLIYGPAASGKTTLCKLASIEQAKNNKKTLYIDTENGFSIERFKQLSNNNLKLLDKILILKIKNLQDQSNKIKQIFKLKNIDLVIIDSFGKYYRKEVKKDYKLANKLIMDQLSLLKQIARNKIPILISNQVYTNINSKEITPLCGRLITRESNTIIELQKDPKRTLIIKKPKEKEMLFKIEEQGIKKI